MFDADPLGDGAVHPPVYVSCDARDGPARHAYLRLKHRRSVHDDDLAFRLRIDGKLNPIIKSARIFKSGPSDEAPFGGHCLFFVLEALRGHLLRRWMQRCLHGADTRVSKFQ